MERAKFSRPQAEIRSEKKRKANIRWAFKVNPAAQFTIPGSKFVLFDDVWTTGSTLKEAGQRLKRAGVKEVWGLTLAR